MNELDAWITHCQYDNDDMHFFPSYFQDSRCLWCGITFGMWVDSFQVKLCECWEEAKQDREIVL